MNQMSPKVRQAEAEKRAGERYEFTLGDGDDVRHLHLEPLDSVDGGFMRSMRGMNEVDQAIALLEELADAETLAALDELKRPAYNAFIEKWQRWLQVTPGESSASST